MKSLNRNLFLLLAFILSVGVYGQNISFEQIAPIAPNYTLIANFEAVRFSDLKFGDIDGDGDEDVVIIGLSGTGDRIAQLYKNDSSFGFRRMWSDTILMGSSHGTVDFSDVDGDNDLDILITGIKAGLQSHPSTNLYFNDGSGNYSQDTSNTFIQVSLSSVAFFDMDGDSDEDVLISGRTISGLVLIELYENDGSGKFSLVTGMPFDSIQYGAIAVADIDNDSDIDVLISGLNNNSARISELYLNDGSGSFSDTQNDTILDGVQDGDIAFYDVDYNGTQDLLLVGKNNSNQNIAKLFSNNGSGIFNLLTNSSIAGVREADVSFADINNDSFADIFVLGLNDTRLYTNNGKGEFTRFLADSVFKTVSNGAVEFSDIDGDNDLDVLITGELYPAGLAEMYYNDGIGNFTFVAGTAIDGGGTIALADIDGDSDLDAFMMGYNYNFDYHAHIYLNDGEGNYTLWDSTTILALENATSDFADFDGDGDQDLLISGGLLTSGARRTQLYKNNGSGVFTLVSGTPFVNVEFGDIEIGDIDGDNDLDVLITGSNSGSGNGAHTSLYKNDGSGNFTLVSGISLDYVKNGAVKFGDIDGDDDLDLVMSGLSLYSNANETTVYLNDGNGNFSAIVDPFIDLQWGSTAIGDVDGDGDNDVIINGWQSSSFGNRCRIYLNNGNGTFTYLRELQGTERGTVVLADLDNDSDLDVLITGYGKSNAVTLVYTNDGNAIFTLAPNLVLDQFREAVALVADINNDTKKDIILSGINISRQYVTKLYSNTTCIANYVNDSIVACDSFVWQDGSTYFEDNTTAKHTLTNTLGCDSIISLKLKLTAIDHTITQTGAKLSAVLQNGATYQWLNCDSSFLAISGENNPTFTAPTSGNYAVKIARNQCVDTTACKTVSLMAIDRIDEQIYFRIYPNPAFDKLKIKTKLPNAYVIIYNNFGQPVASNPFANNETDISHLPKGVYYVVLSNGDKSLSPKVFIKQ